MRKILFLLFSGCVTMAMGQNNDQAAAKLPQVLPPGPEAASIIKAGQLSVGLHTGSAQASVPICELKAGELVYPISLNYASNGFKVDAIPSRVGMDWSLSMGVVSRTVHGIPDEKATHPPMPANLYANTQEVLDYYEEISSEGNYEGEPDEFNYSAPGVSGKFILDYTTGEPVSLTYSQNKINVVRNLTAQEITQIIITSTNGTRYFFGGTMATEQTISHNIAGSILQKQHIKTAFFLYRIENVYGDYIKLTYSPVTINTKAGVSMNVSNHNGMIRNCRGWTEIMPQCPSYNIESNGSSGILSQISYETVYPTSVLSNTGGVVNFFYENRPDLSGDKRLTAITILQDEHPLKTINLSYVTPANYSGSGSCFNISVAEVNKRFFLSEVSVNSSDLQSPPLNYSMSYNDISALPYRLSYSQDHFGFYNGKSNTTLLPNIPGYSYWFGSFGSADRSPDGNFSSKGLLTQINYPTGGSETFVYESNTVPFNGSNIEAGGVRIKQTKSFDPVTQKEISKFYRYATLLQPAVSTGIAPLSGKYVAYSYNEQPCPTNSDAPMVCGNIHLYSNSLASLFYFQGNHIGYTCITESDDQNNIHGATEHYFQTEIQGPLSTAIRGTLIDNVPGATVATLNGTEYRTRMVNSSGQTVKDVLQEYSTDNRVFVSKYAVSGRKNWTYVMGDGNDRFLAFDITQYQYQSFWHHLDKTTVKEYNPATGQMMETVTNYNYDQLYHLQPNRITTTSSEMETLVTEKKFAQDLVGETYPQGQHPYEAMVTANIFDPVIEERVYRNTSPNSTSLINYTRNEMVRFSGGVKPSYINLQKGSNAAETRIRFHKYSDEGQPLEMSKENDTRVSFIWDYKHQLPVAEAANASWNDIAYTSFEADGTGNWSVPGTVQGVLFFTGFKSYALTGGNITNGKYDPAKHLNYIIQCWTNNAQQVLVNGVAGTQLMTKNGWYLMEFRLNDPTTITISGTAVIDELRMFPEKAQMKTLTYLTGVGTLTVNDARSNVTFYEYDGFNRLLRIRDIDRNIIKQMDYKYGQSITPCANTTANWVATGNLRCQKNAGNCNTGTQEHEERDMNNCSSTYYTTRWISNGTNSACQACTTANCTGNDKKCVNCVCETGTRINVSSVYNRSTGQYTCTYYYSWSDGSVSGYYTETTSSPCSIGS